MINSGALLQWMNSSALLQWMGDNWHQTNFFITWLKVLNFWQTKPDHTLCFLELPKDFQQINTWSSCSNRVQMVHSDTFYSKCLQFAFRNPLNRGQHVLVIKDPPINLLALNRVVYLKINNKNNSLIPLEKKIVYVGDCL